MSTVTDPSLVDLLGDARARVVQALRGTSRTVADLSAELGVTEGAVRRHLQALERDGLVDAETVRREGPGRPSAYYALTDRAHRLFPDRSAELANQLLDYLQAEHGRSSLLAFLRWRQARQDERYRAELDDAGGTPQRLERLAGLLTEDGFPSQVRPIDTPEGATVLELRQEHCAIADVAAEHPELCAYEAALFSKVLDAKVSRRSTIAGGAHACVCHITPKNRQASNSPNKNTTNKNSGTTDTGARDGHQS